MKSIRYLRAAIGWNGQKTLKEVNPRQTRLTHDPAVGYIVFGCRDNSHLPRGRSTYPSQDTALTECGNTYNKYFSKSLHWPNKSRCPSKDQSQLDVF